MRRLNYPFTVLRLSPSIRCNFACKYCTHFEYQKELIQKRKQEVAPEVWIKHLARVMPLRELTLIFGTGEPTLYKGISDIINSTEYTTFLYTNASDMAMKEMRKIKKRGSFLVYVSYHPSGIKVDNFADNAKWIQDTFGVIDFHGVPFEGNNVRLIKDKEILAKQGIKLDINHPLVGWFDGEFNFYGKLAEEPRFREPFAARNGGQKKTVLCKSSFNHANGPILGYPVGPDGSIYTCWRYMLNSMDEGVLGSFFDEEFVFKDDYYECSNYGDCAICHWSKNIVDKETNRQLDNDVIDRVYV